MSSLVVNAQDNIQYVSFSPDESGLQIAVLTNQKIQIFSLPERGLGDAPLLGELNLPEIDAKNETYAKQPIRQLCWISETQFVYCQYDEELQTDMLCVANFTLGNETMNVVANPLDNVVGRIYFNVSTKDLIVEEMSGAVYNIGLEDQAPELTKIEQLV
jgi:elongator complex protein 1